MVNILKQFLYQIALLPYVSSQKVLTITALAIMTLGALGGSTIVTAVFQVFLNTVEYDMTL